MNPARLITALVSEVCGLKNILKFFFVSNEWEIMRENVTSTMLDISENASLHFNK